MKTPDLIDDLLAVVPTSRRREFLIYSRILVQYLHDHSYQVELASGNRILDGTDVRVWLHELDDVMGQVLASTKVSTTPGNGTRPEGQNRYVIDPTCPRCGHVHAEEKECGAKLGGERICRCVRAVPA